MLLILQNKIVCLFIFYYNKEIFVKDVADSQGKNKLSAGLLPSSAYSC